MGLRMVQVDAFTDTCQQPGRRVSCRHRDCGQGVATFL
jgi:hypothetical protein